MEVGIIEGTKALILKYYKAHFELQQKIDHLFFHENLQFEEWMLWYILWRFQIREESSFLNVLYQQCSKNKGAFQVMCITADAQNVDYHHYHPQDLTTLQKRSRITNGRETSKINHSDLS